MFNLPLSSSWPNIVFGLHIWFFMRLATSSARNTYQHPTSAMCFRATILHSNTTATSEVCHTSGDVISPFVMRSPIGTEPLRPLSCSSMEVPLRIGQNHISDWLTLNTPTGQLLLGGERRVCAAPKGRKTSCAHR